MEKYFAVPTLPDNPKKKKPSRARSEQHNTVAEILAGFTPDEQAIIQDRQKVLSALAYYIGKDFSIPVELNSPGEGWHWDFKDNIIRIDPKDLLEKPMDYLRFVICHEGGHRRISRTDFIPPEVWRQPGFSFMMNAIEDPRDNNFVAESYPKFREQMKLVYEQDLDFEGKGKKRAKEKLGTTPRFMQAGFEYIKQWYRSHKKEPMVIDASLPESVQDAVRKTLEAASVSWRIYPTHDIADGLEKDKAGLSGEESIVRHAKKSFEVNRDNIWPEFQMLVEQDLEDQKMQEFLKDQEEQEENGEGDAKGGTKGIPQELKDKLSPEEQKELEGAIEKAIEEAKKEAAEKSADEDAGDGEGGDEAGEGGEEVGGVEKGGVENEGKNEAEGEGVPIDLDSLSEELKQKIKEYINSLTQVQQADLAERAQQTLKEFEDKLNEELQGKLSENPEQRAAHSREGRDAKSSEDEKHAQSAWRKEEQEREKTSEALRKKMEQAFESGPSSPYEKTLAEIAPFIDALTGDLRDVFVKRKMNKFEADYRHGRRWNINKRIREKAANIPLLKTESREQPEGRSEEKDYAITLLVDLSGSMSGEKIQEAFKSAILLAETLQNLNIKFEIVGFQDTVLEFKGFEDELNESMRLRLNQLPLEVSGLNPGGHNNPEDNDDGACLKEASRRLAEQKASQKLLIVLSDGLPERRGKSRSALNEELKTAIKEITQNTDQKLIGIGLLSNAVSQFYENNLPNVSTEDVAATVGEIIREIIERY